MGSNGLTATETIQAKVRCPEKPTKRKFKTRREADDAAVAASAKAKMPIVAYACSGCGYFHLTRKVNGSDIVHDNDAAIVTPAMRTRLRVVEKPAVERNWEVFPRVPGNALAREKMFREYIAANPGPLAIADVREALSCGVDAARRALQGHGYVAKRGPGAKWMPPEEPVQPTVEPEAEPEPAEWRTPTSFPAHISIDDYVRAMEGVGLKVRIQVRDA